jgi:hypothetical protein
MAEWEEALQSDQQRQAKLIVMEAIAAAARRARRMAILEAASVAEVAEAPAIQQGILALLEKE